MSERYLFCQAGGYAFLLRAEFMRHIWSQEESPPDDFHATNPIDLRQRIGGASQPNFISLGLDLPGGLSVLLVERIGRFAEIDDDEFLALPAVFDFAGALFDAACRREIEGAYPLRLRLGA
ncbi:MAG TPA: hypothetical protein VGG12_07895 [Methylovirgula sp.]|jgi:hypothetical protein